MGWLAVVGLKYLLRCSHQVLLSWLSLAAQLYSFRRWIHQFAYVIYSFSIVLVNQTKLGKPIVPDGEPLGLKPKLDVFDVILVGPQPSCTLFWPLKNWGEKIHFTSLTMGRVHWLVSPSGFSFLFVLDNFLKNYNKSHKNHKMENLILLDSTWVDLYSD